MTKIRILIFLLTLTVVFSLGTLAFLYAKGYRIDSKNRKISANGLLLIKSNPDGAQVFLNGELKTATNATLSLPPNTYDVSVKKEGFLTWNKRLLIEKEIVTEATAHLFKSAPSLSAITFTGVSNVVPSPDFSKISYVVSGNSTNLENQGLWIIDNANLPLGFSKDPRRITDGDLNDASWIWSPNGRQILLTTKKGTYLIETSNFVSQSQRVNVAAQKNKILKDWEDEKDNRKANQIKKLPEKLREVFLNNVQTFSFSPDEKMILYTASSSASLEKGITKPLPGSSTQKESREIEKGKTYVYDIIEDKNFLIDENGDNLLIEGGYTKETPRRISWYPSSRHLILSDEGKIIIMDYDGTNRQVVYSGSYILPHAYPTLSSDRLIILTNLGANDTPPNLYFLSIK